MKIEPKVWRLSPKYEDWAQSMKIEPKVWRLSPKYEDWAQSMKIEPEVWRSSPTPAQKNQARPTSTAKVNKILKKQLSG
jgi:hypothetical protein